MRLDTKTIAGLALPPGKSEQFHWDDELKGYGFRLRQRGGRLHRTWIVQYRASGRTRRTTLGPAEVLLAFEARTAARKILAGVALGGDPQREREAKRQAQSRTFAAVAAAYLEARQPGLRPASYRIADLYLTGAYFKSLHPMAISGITHADVAAALRTIERERSAATAAAARRAVSAFFGWAIAEGLMGERPVNPVIGTRRPADPKPRDRVLTSSELAAIWNATDSDEYDRILRLLMLLGSRASEIGGLRWSELDLDAGTWILPGGRSKNHRAHTVTLPAPALEILQTIPRRPGRDHLFGTRVDGFVCWPGKKRVLDRRLGDRVAAWVVHDIRRTVATGMAEIGVAPHIVEAVLNHHGGHRAGVAGVYNRARYDKEVTAALARWAEYVLDMADGRKINTNVVALRA
jgi:integrase